MKRIQRISEYIYPYKKIADVGTDHGYLICEALKNNLITKAIAIDNKKGPLDFCKKNVSVLDKNNIVRYSLSNGIEDIDDDTEVVIIAGMGGILITDILSGNIRNIKRLIIEANRDTLLVRKKLMELNFLIVKEEVVYENDKYYEIIVSERSFNKVVYSDIELEYGPFLISNKSPIFLEMLKEKRSKLTNISLTQNGIIKEKTFKKIETINKLIK